MNQMLRVSTLVFAVQGAAMLWDEFHFHRKRGLPRWEKLGHPLDTLTVLLCYGMVLFRPYSRSALKIYCAFAILSCLSVTKDEHLHARLCSPAEHWLHSVLFILHPVILGCTASLWPAIHSEVGAPWSPERLWIIGQAGLTGIFLAYQVACAAIPGAKQEKGTGGAWP